jgi:outer membrane protein
MQFAPGPLGVALAVVVTVAAAHAQTPAQPTTQKPAPPAQPPGNIVPVQKPGAPAQPPANITPTLPGPKVPAPTAAPAAPPKPFPEGAKIAYVVLQRVANESAEGKAATARIQALQQKKATELNEKNKQLQGLQQKLEKEGSVMSATAQADVQKQVERLQVDIQRFTQDAQQEIQDLQAQLQQQFQTRIEPVLAQVGQEKGLHFIFNGPDSGLVWADAGLDISADVIKKLDAAPPGGAKPPGQ